MNMGRRVTVRTHTAPKGQRLDVTDPDVRLQLTRMPVDLFIYPFFWHRGSFFSANATLIPATETATAQKSRGRYNANVVGGFDFSQPLQRRCSVWQPRRRSSPGARFSRLSTFGRCVSESKKKKRHPTRFIHPPQTAMDETDIMDLTHQKARKRPRPISSVDESVHASLKRLPIRAAECREPSSLMFAVRGEPVPAASLKQNDHSVTSSPNTVMPAQVNA